MTKVLKADGAVADARATIDLGANQANSWTTLRVGFDSVSLALPLDAFFLRLWNPANDTLLDYAHTANDGTQYWENLGGFGYTPAPTADSLHLIELHHVNGGTIELFVDGVSIGSGIDGFSEDVRFVEVGLTAGAGYPAGSLYISHVKVGPTRGSGAVFDDDFSGDLSAWATDGDVSIVDSPFAAAGGRGRVSIGFDANMFDAAPVWTVIDNLQPNLVARIEVSDGRQTDRDQTEPGSCTVWLNDQDGIFDPHNPSGPYYGKLDGKPLRICVWNPVDEEWVPEWRGTMDNPQTVLNPATEDGVSINANIQIDCVDMLDYLGRAGMRVGVDGDTPPAGSEGIVFYEDGPVANPGGPPGRIESLLINARIDPDMFTVFSGNVDVLEGKYDDGDAYLIGLRDAGDAEFPGLANIYIDKLGRFVFHGRFARLTPDEVAADAGAAWDFNRWKVGDGAAIALDSDCAQIREFSYARPREMLINSATSYPETNADGTALDNMAIAGQRAEDSASIDEFGLHTREDINLLVKGLKDESEDGLQQCARIATFWATYYSQPLTRIDRIVLKPLRPTDPRAAATWGVLTGVSISDIVNINVGYPGGVGIQDTDYYVEGRHLTIEPLTPIEQGGFDMVTLELNVSPAIEDTEGIFVTI